jgi:hypothetical protein
LGIPRRCAFAPPPRGSVDRWWHQQAFPGSILIWRTGRFTFFSIFLHWPATREGAREFNTPYSIFDQVTLAHQFAKVPAWEGRGPCVRPVRGSQGEASLGLVVADRGKYQAPVLRSAAYRADQLAAKCRSGPRSGQSIGVKTDGGI